MICGATGMVGKRLTAHLHTLGGRLVLVGRDADSIRRAFPFGVEALAWNQLPDYDSSQIEQIVNLAGAGVSEQKWTTEYKQTMRDSRLQSTQQCVELCRKNHAIRLINASAVSAYGFYDGDHPAFAEADRDRRSGNNFLQQLIDDWERTAMQAHASGNPVVLLRIGVVLAREGGALPAMAAPFRFFFGGPAGSGEQIMSWIGLRDLVGGIAFLIEHGEVTGPVNMVSPGHCRQAEFARALGAALGKPSLLKTPAPMIRLMMGQMGQELVLTGQKVLPEKLLRAGFEFRDPELSALLRDLYASR